jgi:hypothetical protein
MQRFLAAVITVLLVAGGLAVALDHRPIEVRKVSINETELRPGQTEVTGFVTYVRASPVDGPSLPLPLTIAVPQRGAGGAVISQAVIGKNRVSIVWDGGTPLVLRGPGALDVSPATVEVSAGGVRWFLDDHPATFTTPGRYAALAPVAVGTAGLATPRAGADFTADATTGLSTHGGAYTDQPLAPVTLNGPGVVRMEGRLRVRTKEGAAKRDTVAFPAGSYQLKLTPGPDGIRIEALFEVVSTG